MEKREKRSLYYKEWYKKNKERKQAKNKEWKQNNRARVNYLQNLRYVKRPRPTLESRLLSKLEKVGDCWEWIGLRYPSGYGRISLGKNKGRYVHRIAYEIFVGAIPHGMCVCHSCDNPPCFNPKHLWIGTMKDNMADRDRKGRGRYPKSRIAISPDQKTPSESRV